MAVNEKLSFMHLNGMQPETQESIRAGWDAAFARAAAVDDSGKNQGQPVSASWDRAFRRAQGRR